MIVTTSARPKEASAYAPPHLVAPDVEAHVAKSSFYFTSAVNMKLQMWLMDSKQITRRMIMKES